MSFQALRGLLSGRASPASPVGGRVEPLLVADQPEAATDAPLPDADVAAAIGHEADAAARVLTAPGGPLEAPEEARRIVANWSEGRVMGKDRKHGVGGKTGTGRLDHSDGRSIKTKRREKNGEEDHN